MRLHLQPLTTTLHINVRGDGANDESSYNETISYNSKSIAGGIYNLLTSFSFQTVLYFHSILALFSFHC